MWFYCQFPVVYGLGTVGTWYKGFLAKISANFVKNGQIWFLAVSMATIEFLDFWKSWQQIAPKGASVYKI